MNDIIRENLELRKILWLSHGHQGIYGDDGEMQCAQCHLDYKRDPVERLRAVSYASIQESFAAAIQRAKDEAIAGLSRGMTNKRVMPWNSNSEMSCESALRIDAESGILVHGINCKKERHSKLSGGYLHDEGDDDAYEVDGMLYCGRCHYAL